MVNPTTMDIMFQERLIMAAKGLVHREERGDPMDKIERARKSFVDIHKNYHDYLIAVAQKNEVEMERIEGLYSADIEKHMREYKG